MNFDQVFILITNLLSFLKNIGDTAEVVVPIIVIVILLIAIAILIMICILHLRKRKKKGIYTLDHALSEVASLWSD